MTTESNIALADQVLASKPKREPRPSRRDLGEIRGSGIIVCQRRADGRLTAAHKPFEHADRDAAVAEAARLAAANPGTTFVVLTQIEAVMVPKGEV